MAGYSHVNIDGTLIETDRCRTPGPTPGVDLWWSGKHANHGGNIQVITAPGRLAAVDLRRAARPRTRHHRPARPTPNPARPGPEPPTTCARSATSATKAKSDTITVAFKKPKDGELHQPMQQQLNKAHNGIRAIGERGNSLLKTTFKALRNVSLCPWRIGKIVAAALVLLHIDHDRTT